MRPTLRRWADMTDAPDDRSPVRPTCEMALTAGNAAAPRDRPGGSRGPRVTIPRGAVPWVPGDPARRLPACAARLPCRPQRSPPPGSPGHCRGRQRAPARERRVPACSRRPVLLPTHANGMAIVNVSVPVTGFTRRDNGTSGRWRAGSRHENSEPRGGAADGERPSHRGPGR